MTAPAMLRATPFDADWEFACSAWLDDGDKTKKLGFSQLQWLSAQVPGHVHLDLMRHGIIADPFVGRAELGCQWVDETAWRYRRRFSFTPDAARPRRVLCFQGLDTVCRVSLNGELLAEHDNMFVPLWLDVTDKLKPGDNELSLEFDAAARVGRERRARYFQREGLPDDVARFPERAFVRKAQYMFAWDWGPRLVSAGIWRAVTLLEFAARSSDVLVAQKHLPGGAVELAFRSEWQGEGSVFHCVEGLAEAVPDGAVATLSQPELWWPVGFGAQRLHRVDSFLVPKGYAGALTREALAAAALDLKSQRIGLRTARLLREPDQQGESFEFEVNGKKLWALGANWIPDHSFPSIVDRARLRAQLERAVDMNMNMLRVWGGGVYESDDFYELCDELGLLVWQDFPFACSYVPDDEPARAALAAEAEINIKRLRNHPSLVLWCGNNENLTMWHSKWDRPQPQPHRYYGEVLYDVTLPDAVRRFDPDRPYIASSPIGGQNANDGDIGDQHYWDVWHGRGDWKHYKDSTGRFASEFGFASAPGRSVWRRIFSGVGQSHAVDWSRRDVRDALACWHDKTGKGYETYVSYVELHYPAARDLEEFTYTSQLNQRDALRFGIEHFRRSAGCRGSLIWQLNDCWPVQSWAVLDSDGAYKAAAFELRRLYAPALLSIEFEVGAPSARFWTLLDNRAEGVSGELVVEAIQVADGRLLAQHRTVVSLEPGEHRVSLTLPLGEFSRSETLLSATFLGSQTFRLLAEPKDMKLEAPKLAARPHPEGVMIVTDRPVIDLFLWDEDERGAFELYDNFVTLPRAGEYLLRGRGGWGSLCARSLAGRHPLEA